MGYRFKANGRWEYHSQETLPAELRIHNPEGELVELQRLEPSESITVVGMVQAMDGRMEGQVNELRSRADKWGMAIKNGWIPRNIAWQGMQTMIWPSLKYPLPACNMTEIEGKSILTGFYKNVLPKMGICRNIPLVFRYAPTCLQGLGLPDPYVEQGIAQIKFLLTGGHICNLPGNLIRASLEQAQLEIGTSTPLLQAPFAVFGCLLTKNTWIGSVWQFVSKRGIEMRSESLTLPKCQREGDYFLMDCLTALGVFSTAQL